MVQSTGSDQPKICVVGSLSRDIFLKVKKLPMVGETIASDGVVYAFGGKGANTAVAAAKLGVTTRMMGQVGNDADGKEYISYLQMPEQGNVDTTGIRVLEGIPTGQAYILSFDGDNSIVINGGTNMAYGDEPLAKEWVTAIEESDVLLLQREIPDKVNIKATQAAAEAKKKGKNITVIFDLGGRDKDYLSPNLISNCDILSPNETEAMRLFETQLNQNAQLEKPESIVLEANQEKLTEEETALMEKAFAFLSAKHDSLRILFKLGERGAALISIDKDDRKKLRCIRIPAKKFSDHPDLSLVDTTGAGDTFTAAYAVDMVKQQKSGNGQVNEVQALKYATTAAFLTITRFGAMPALPTKEEVDKIL